jgi:hypothetical protein
MKAMGVSGIFYCWKQGSKAIRGLFISSIGYLQLNFSQKPFIFLKGRAHEILIHNNFKI